MASWLLSLAYASVFAKLTRHSIRSIRQTLPFFAAALAFSSLYSAFFSHAMNWPVASVPMAVLRFLALLEAVYRVFQDKTRSRLLSQHAALQLAYTGVQLATLTTYPLMTVRPIWDGHQWGYPAWEVGSRAYAFATLIILIAYHRVLTDCELAAEGAVAEVADRQPGRREPSREGQPLD
jgi:hypothetical protein